MMTLKEFTEKHTLHLKIYSVPFRTDLIETDWDKEAKHFLFKITRPETLEILKGSYSQGSGVKNRPTAEDILNSYLLDTMNIDSISFNEWCDEYGYTDDSLKAHKIYSSCLDESVKLKKFFTTEQLKELYECETL